MGFDITDPLTRMLELAGMKSATHDDMPTELSSSPTHDRASPAQKPMMQRRALIEGQKSLRDYMREAVAVPPGSSSTSSSTTTSSTSTIDPNDPETIGNDRMSAIKNLQTRLGPNTTASKAQQTFDKLKGAGGIKQSGNKVTMKPMGDDDFKSAIGEDEDAIPQKKSKRLFIDWNAGKKPPRR